MTITRRDFLNGVAITIAAGVAPIELLRAAPNSDLALQTLADYYPPSLTGLRGSHEGSYEAAHAVSRGRKTYDYPNIPLLEEEYDLIDRKSTRLNSSHVRI